MKWGEWKQWMAEHGIKDEDEIAYIDCSWPQDAAIVEHPVYFKDGHRLAEPIITPRWAIW